MDKSVLLFFSAGRDSQPDLPYVSVFAALSRPAPRYSCTRCVLQRRPAAFQYRCTARHAHLFCPQSRKGGFPIDTIVYREASTLARDLGIPLQTLYAVSNRLDAHYHSVRIPKRGGGIRTLTVPDAVLKTIQRAIAQRLLAYMPVSRYASAYRHGASAVKNATPHAGQKYILKLDVLHFFDSILYSMVKETAFPAGTYAEPLRVLLTMLCYHRDALPQGAPTSPALVNILMRGFDEDVGAWCRARGVRYTRYCDDMTFSASHPLDGVHGYVRDRLRAMGLFLNERKTAQFHAGQRMTVTGLTVNDRPNLPAPARRSLRQTLYYCKKFGVAAHLARTGSELDAPAYLRHLLGQLSFWLQADPHSREAAEYRRWVLSQLRSLESQ